MSVGRETRGGDGMEPGQEEPGQEVRGRCCPGIEKAVHLANVTLESSREGRRI